MAPALPGVLSRLPSFRSAMDSPTQASPSRAASSPSSAAANPPAQHNNSSSSSSAATSKSIRWRKGELIGAGAFGRVYMGMNLDSGELLAVKQVLIAANNVAKEKAQAHVRELEEEVKLLQNLSHPNIVRYLGTAREDEALNIFLEFVPGGSIASLLGKFGSFPEPVVRMYARQLLEGLQYLHKNGIMHRDIKGANILVDNKGCIKLADFGASKQVVELVTLSGAKSMKGTPYWMAPEVIRQTGHSLPADIWSVGCTIIEMATGKPPWSQQFQEVAALFHIGTTKSHPPIPEHLSNNAKDFLLKCLKKEPHLRPTATELLQHPFVNPLEHPMAVRVSTQMVNAIKVSQAFDHSKKQQLVNPLQESNSIIKRSMALFQKSTSFFRDNNDKKENQPFEPDLNCSVILDCDSFTSFKSTCEPPKFYEPGWNKSDFIQVAGSACLKQKSPQNSYNPMAEPNSYNPMAEPNSFNPMSESTTNIFNPMSESTTNMFNPMSESTTNIFNPMTEPTSYNPMSESTCLNNNLFAFTQDKSEEGLAPHTDQPAPDDSEFSFQCGLGYDDEEVTETKIKAFIDEKALELKRLQTPLYMEYHSIQNPPPDTSSGRNCPAPLSPAPGRQVGTLTNSRSQSKASASSRGLSIACSRDTGASASSGSPSANNRSVNFSPAVESPRLSEWKGLLLETQQPVPSPRSLSSSEQHRLWKEELQKELEIRREEKRMLSRLASSSKASPARKTDSPRGTPRHAVLKAS